MCISQHRFGLNKNKKNLYYDNIIMYICNMKICSKCKIEKELSEFFNNSAMKDGKSNYCKLCHAAEGAKRKDTYKEKKYYLNRKDKISIYGKQWYQENKERLKPIRKKYREDNQDKQIDAHKEWYRNNREDKLNKNAEYEKIQMLTNPLFRIKKNLRCRVSKILNGRVKHQGTIQLLGCTIAEFKIHLESLFTDDMTWDNYGSYWHVDHIKPCSLFNLLLEEEQMKCFHYSNMQPLKAEDNLKKYNKFKIE